MSNTKSQYQNVYSLTYRSTFKIECTCANNKDMNTIDLLYLKVNTPFCDRKGHA